MTGRPDAGRQDGFRARPVDEARLAEWRRARRAVVRRDHPDRGGDAETMNRHLAEVDRAFALAAPRVAPPRGPAPRVHVVRRSRGEKVALTLRSARRRLTGWARRRRYIDL